MQKKRIRIISAAVAVAIPLGTAVIGAVGVPAAQAQTITVAKTNLPTIVGPIAFGSDKLPPLPWWLVEIMYRSFGVDAPYYALAQAAVVIAFALVFATARPLVGATGGLIAVLVLMTVFSFPAALR